MLSQLSESSASSHLCGYDVYNRSNWAFSHCS